MAVRRKHKGIDTEKKSNVPEKQIVKEESEVSTHANSMASRRKKDQDESEEGGIWYYKNRSEIEEN